MHDFTIGQMLRHGWPVLSVLLVMSIFSVTTIVDRYKALRQARIDARQFVRNLLNILATYGMAEALAYCEKYPKPVAVVAREVLMAKGGPEHRERALQHALQGQVSELERYVPLLGTIASTAPFVGLFGTVVGIIKAFADIALNVGGGPEVVSAGIAEALITTACGLLVAIPAVMGYNYFAHKIQRFADEVEFAVYDLVEREPAAG